MYWLTCVLLLLASLLYSASAKPTQPEASESATAPMRRMDTLAGMTIGANKATRSTRAFARSLDSLGDANYLRSVDTASIEGQNYQHPMESLVDILRELDPEFVSQLIEYANRRGHRSGIQLVPINRDPLELQRLDYRTLDSLGGANLLRSVGRPPSGAAGVKSASASVIGGNQHNANGAKRLDSLSGLSLGLQKRTFDEVDRTAFDGFNKRDFDEVDRGFDGFSKRNVRSVAN